MRWLGTTRISLPIKSSSLKLPLVCLLSSSFLSNYLICGFFSGHFRSSKSVFYTNLCCFLNSLSDSKIFTISCFFNDDFPRFLNNRL